MIPVHARGVKPPLRAPQREPASLRGSPRSCDARTVPLLRSLARGLDLLDAMVEDARRLGPDASLAVGEIARRLDVDKSSASRLARTLAERAYLERGPADRRYRLGPRMRHAAVGPGAHERLREHARPFLYLLMKQTGECAHTAVLSGGQALIVDDVESAASLRVTGGVGRLNALHCTAVGKCLLAFGDTEPPDRLPRRTDRTITDHDALTEELARTRDRGWAFDDVENEPGVRCLAAPVRDAGGDTVACIGISGPTVRMPRARVPELARLVTDAARDLSVALAPPLAPASTPAPSRHALSRKESR